MEGFPHSLWNQLRRTRIEGALIGVTTTFRGVQYKTEHIAGVAFGRATMKDLIEMVYHAKCRTLHYPQKSVKVRVWVTRQDDLLS